MAGDRKRIHSKLRALGENPDSKAVTDYYDAWAEDYDRDLRDWNYTVPALAAQLLSREVPLDGTVLDAGCGTGLTGAALKDAGFRHIEGMDISQNSLDVAGRAGIYTRLKQVDMQQLPLPYETDAFAGLQCIGVLTYVPDTDGILREFCRIVRPGGLVIFTQRDDVFAERDCATVLSNVENEGVWQKVSISEPLPYVPGHPDFADQIKAFCCVYRIL